MVEFLYFDICPHGTFWIFSRRYAGMVCQLLPWGPKGYTLKFDKFNVHAMFSLKHDNFKFVGLRWVILAYLKLRLPKLSSELNNNSPKLAHLNLKLANLHRRLTNLDPKVRPPKKYRLEGIKLHRGQVGQSMPQGGQSMPHVGQSLPQAGQSMPKLINLCPWLANLCPNWPIFDKVSQSMTKLANLCPRWPIYAPVSKSMPNWQIYAQWWKIYAQSWPIYAQSQPIYAPC